MSTEAKATIEEVGAPQTTSDNPATSTPANQTQVNNTIQALRTNSVKIATYIKTKTADAMAQTSAKLAQKPWTQEPNGLQSLKTTAADTLAKAAEGGAWIYQASVKTAVKTAEELRRMTWFTESVSSLSKSEARLYPCPRVIMACCYTLAASGLEAEGLFKVDASANEVNFCLSQLGQGLVLFPAGTSPHTVAGVLKSFLSNLQEPLLTYRLLPSWLAAMDDMDLIRTLVQQLPAANRNSLALLMATCHSIAGQAAINEMDSQALAEVFAPLLLWRPPVKVEQGSSPKSVSGRSNSTSIPVQFPEDDVLVLEKPGTPPVPKATPEQPLARIALDVNQLQACERLVETMISNSLSLF